MEYHLTVHQFSSFFYCLMIAINEIIADDLTLRQFSFNFPPSIYSRFTLKDEAEQSFCLLMLQYNDDEDVITQHGIVPLLQLTLMPSPSNLCIQSHCGSLTCIHPALCVLPYSIELDCTVYSHTSILSPKISRLKQLS